MKFTNGERVRSCEIRNVKEFEGVIVNAFKNGKGADCYHVEDGFGNRWHRDNADLETVQ